MASILPSNPTCNLLWQQQQGMKLASRTSSGCRVIRAMASPTISAPKREKDPKKRVVITGMGLVSAFGSDVDKYYDRLLAGESAVAVIEDFDVSDLPVHIAAQIHGFSSEGYIDPKKDKLIDDFCKYCLVAGKRALKDANLGPEVLKKMDRTRIGVIVGSGTGGATILGNGVQNFLKEGSKTVSPHFIPHHILNAAAAMLAIDAGLMGLSYCISTACATSNYCICAAANHIRRGDADIVIAGGTEAGVTRHGVAGFVACRALSQRNDAPQAASRPWDKDRDGFVMGEGCGLLVMESLEHAMKRGAKIVAEYLGGATTCDAYHLTDPRPDGLGVSACITKALQYSGVSPEEVNYVNAHATSTPAGDVAEVIAMKKVFKDTSEMKMNSTKSMIGHGMGAAGGLEAIATIKAITTGWLHPTLNQHNLDPEVTIDTVPNTKKRHEVNVAISNSFGFGGHNAVVVFAPFTP
ncbi:3-oxoacyl-[acyl-carrier-protein] synthase I, chloroplastic [Ancistrocladus abbreviatus]